MKRKSFFPLCALSKNHGNYRSKTNRYVRGITVIFLYVEYNKPIYQ